MPSISRSEIVPYTTDQMFDLVNGVESYPEFIPYCQKATVDRQAEDKVKAQLVFAKGMMHKSFTTMNHLQPHKMLTMSLLDGPFRHLEGFWRFESLEDGCQVSMDLSFEFSSKMIGMMFGPLFNPVATRLVETFCERAQVIYGSDND